MIQSNAFTVGQCTSNNAMRIAVEDWGVGGTDPRNLEKFSKFESIRTLILTISVGFPCEYPFFETGSLTGNP